MLRLALALICLFTPSATLAQDRLAPDDVLSLTDAPHLSRSAMLSRLEAVVPHLRPRPDRALPQSADPFLWVLTAAFGAPGARLPAGLIHCARYGLDSRDMILSRSQSDPEIFPLVAALRVERADTEAWPDDAVALLRCSFAWDDAQRLIPWSETEATAILTPHFARIARRDDATIRAEAGAHIRDLYGEHGYRMTGWDGTRSGHAWLHSLLISRQISHQRIVFRVYLLGGGM